MMLTVACLFSAFWAAIIVYQLAWGYSAPFLTYFLEMLRNVTWSAFLIVLLGPFQTPKNDASLPKIRVSVFVISALYLVFLIFPSARDPRINIPISWSPH